MDVKQTKEKKSGQAERRVNGLCVPDLKVGGKDILRAERGVKRIECVGVVLSPSKFNSHSG
jgi:hypothetical protein